MIFSLSGQGRNIKESVGVDKEPPRDNFYDRYLHTEKRVLRYDFIHEKDVFWEKRTSRLIDVREKQNHIFVNEIKPFITVLLDATKNGDISLYHVIDDKFSQVLTVDEINAIINTIDTVCVYDPESFKEICQPVVNEFNPEDIKKYRIKEVYFFDEETSKMDVRILGIAPIIDRYDDDGNYLNSGPMFWVYYPKIRESLAREEVFNLNNDAIRFTWEDIFEARLFSSYITKESNVFDRRLKDYISSPMAILLESDKIKQQIFNFEHDLWSY
ncbi:MAG: gliding motility protein GldN [Saprospiraceae bacterium]|nr:gliding motility protein GldN [Saprospiraceae bacterium]